MADFVSLFTWSAPAAWWLVEQGVVGALFLLGSKVWADRLARIEQRALSEALQMHKATLDSQLVLMADNLRLKTEKELTDHKHSIEKSWQSSSAAKQERYERYRQIADLIADFLVLVLQVNLEKRPLTQAELSTYERNRLRAYGYLALHASQDEMDAFDNLVDFINDAISTNNFDFHRFRELALELINHFRISYGINPSPIEYRGHR
jgi:hypothetical protein